jgi:thiol-disulfide isomerase/thioredoxin
MKYLKFFIMLIFVWLSIIQTSLAKNSPNQVTICGNLNFLKDGDSVRIYVRKFGMIDNNPSTHYYSAVNKNSFQFKLSLSERTEYIDVLFYGKGYSKRISGRLIQPGDSINISYSSGEFNFEGQGSLTWKTQMHNEQFIQSKLSILTFSGDENMPRLRYIFELLDGCRQPQFLYLDSLKNAFPANTYSILKAEVIGNLENSKWDLANYYFSVLKSKPQLKSLLDIGNYKDSLLDKYDLRQTTSVNYSNYYIEALVGKYILDSCTLVNRPFEIEKTYSYFKNHIKNNFLKESVITCLLYSKRDANGDLASLVKNALVFVQNKYYVEILDSLLVSKVKGVSAYNFTLEDTYGKLYKLSDFRGKVVLLDFYYTGCGACRKFLPRLKEFEENYHGDPIVFISVCIDKYKDGWIKGIKTGLYNTSKSLNLYTQGRGTDHPIVSNYGINAYPTVILIDKNGKLFANAINPLEDAGEFLETSINEAVKY